MFQSLGLDAFTAIGMIVFGGGAGLLLAIVNLILQLRHDAEGFGWREPVYTALALSVALSLLVWIGDVFENGFSGFGLSTALAVIATLLPTTLLGGLLGRLIGWLTMRAGASLFGR